MPGRIRYDGPMTTRRRFLTAAATLPMAASGIAKDAAPAKPIRYLQIGTGHAHANKLEAYAESPEWEFVSPQSQLSH